MKKKVPPPSKVKYDENHPIVSCRISKADFEKLKTSAVAENLNMVDLLKIGLGIVEKREDNLYTEYKRGYASGFEAAEKKYRINIPCGECDEMITIEQGESMNNLKEFLINHRLHHEGCRYVGYIDGKHVRIQSNNKKIATF
jgi:hypothetical protein